MNTRKAKASPAVVASVEPFRDSVYRIAGRYQVPGNLMLALVCVESAGNPRALSSAGAIGLTQVMPDTLGDINKMIGTSFVPAELYDPETSILAGTVYLHWLIGYFAGNQDLAIRAYNQGPGNITRDPGRGQDYLDKVTAYHTFLNGGGIV